MVLSKVAPEASQLRNDGVDLRRSYVLGNPRKHHCLVDVRRVDYEIGTFPTSSSSERTRDSKGQDLQTYCKGQDESGDWSNSPLPPPATFGRTLLAK
mmetsp:Transcript_4122/g.11363  ORF Transcript_4122/g.11363 Transcript_4122/m.11363 type:complete len:97 (+) Transcript_4122:2206-2496(+)